MEENTTQPTPTVNESSIPSTPPSSVSGKPPRSKLVYIFVALLVLLVLTVGATAAVYISKSLKPKPTPTPLVQAPTPTPKFNTYQNGKFSITYPSNIILSQDKDYPQIQGIGDGISANSSSKVDILVFKPIIPQNDNKNWYKITLEYYPTNAANTEELANKLKQTPPPAGCEAECDTNSTFGKSLKPYKNNEIDGMYSDNISPEVIMAKGGMLYVFTLINISNPKDHLDVFSQLLSTFKFTN